MLIIQRKESRKQFCTLGVMFCPHRYKSWCQILCFTQIWKVVMLDNLIVIPHAVNCDKQDGFLALFFPQAERMNVGENAGTP